MICQQDYFMASKTWPESKKICICTHMHACTHAHTSAYTHTHTHTHTVLYLTTLIPHMAFLKGVLYVV
jgi:hypothetical protein